MEEKSDEEEEVQTSLLPHKPYPWLLIRNISKANEQHIFYSIREDRYYVRFIPELKNKYVACCYGQWLVLCDWCMREYSILNMLTMEKFQLPRFPKKRMMGSPHCVLSSSEMYWRCRVIFFKNDPHKFGFCKFSSCHIGDSKVIKGKLTHQNGHIMDIINFKEKFYALIIPDFNLFVSDFSDPGLRLEQVVSGQSVTANFTFGDHVHLVESCKDLLLIYMSQYDNDEISDVRIFKADFKIGEWVKVETLGDRAIFLGSVNNSFSSLASAFGMKGNVVYWIRVIRDYRYLCMYDIEDKSISMSSPFPSPSPFVETSFHSWVSFPKTCTEEKKLKRKDMSFLFEQGKPQKSEETKTIGKTKRWSWNGLCLCGVRNPKKREETKTIFRKESLWEDLPNDLLLEISSYLFGGDMVAFRSVCKSWYSILPSTWPSKKIVLPLKHSDCSSPLLMCPDNKICHPIFGDVYSMEFLDRPGSKVRAARDGWLLMDNSSRELFFYNPVTKAEIKLPDCPARIYTSVFFSAPPTSANCLVVVAAELGHTSAVYVMKIEYEVWICYEFSQAKFYFSNCNAVAFKDQFYFLGDGAKLLIFYPKKFGFRVIEAPKFICDFMFDRVQQYMLESDGKLIAVFMNIDGSLVCTCEWNASTSEWEIIESLENMMLFVSRPLSLCKRVTIRGTGNKIYFPRVVGEGHNLFYSLATKRYHTFEMGTSYSNFLDSKYYPQHNSWFIP